MTPIDLLKKHMAHGPVSIRGTDPFGEYWVDVSDSAEVMAVDATSTDTRRMKATWKIVPGLSDPNGISFAYAWKTSSYTSTGYLFWSYPGGSSTPHMFASPLSQVTQAAPPYATFYPVPGLTGVGVSFKWIQQGNPSNVKYICIDGGFLRVYADDGTDSFKTRASFHLDRPWDREPLTHMTLVQVNKLWYDPDASNGTGYERDNQTKVTSAYRMYNLEIIPAGSETGRSTTTIEVHKFDDSFFTWDPRTSTEPWAEHRARYRLASVAVNPSAPGSAFMSTTDAASKLKDLFTTIIADARASGTFEQFGIRYAGHGDPNGLFEDVVEPSDVGPVLEHIVGQLGFRIDLLDWGSNCNVGSYDNLRRMAPYADFIIASDLSLGYTTHTGHYDTLLTAGRSLRDTVKALLDADRQGYVAGAADLAARGYHEAVYAFDARRLLELLQRIDLDPAEDDPAVCAANLDCAYPYNGGSARVGDVLTYIRKNAGASAATAFEALRFYGVNSRDLSTWSDNYSKANGLFFVNWLFRT